MKKDRQLRFLNVLAEYLQRRETPLNMILYNGSVFDYDSRIADVDGVVCIEL